jgi:predicted dithiol-disulfide oxidoreductase (DUF899 family)
VSAASRTGTREQWLQARRELLADEKELTRRGDELARRRRELPWVRIDKDYRFVTPEGECSLAELFRGHSQLLVYHFMRTECRGCSSIMDATDGIVVHLESHGISFAAVSRHPLDELLAYRERMGWSAPFASSLGSDFNFDFGVGFSDEMIAGGGSQYNIHEVWDLPGSPQEGPVQDRPGMSAFILEDGVVYHTYSAYARGLDAMWCLYQWLDRTSLGRDEPAWEMRVKDQYGAPAQSTAR